MDPNNTKSHTSSVKTRRGSLNLPNSVGQLLPPLRHSTADMYFSDTSESTVAEHEFDHNGRRKRRRIKPLPPLPRPIVSHSEVYFTETETENDAPISRSQSRKDDLPKLDPPPRVARDKPRLNRHTRQVGKPLPVHTKFASEEKTVNNHNKQSLELALTKSAAKKLGTSHSQDFKERVTHRRPVTKPRPVSRCRSSKSPVYANSHVLLGKNIENTDRV